MIVHNSAPVHDCKPYEHTAMLFKVGLPPHLVAHANPKSEGTGVFLGNYVHDAVPCDVRSKRSIRFLLMRNAYAGSATLVPFDHVKPEMVYAN